MASGYGRGKYITPYCQTGLHHRCPGLLPMARVIRRSVSGKVLERGDVRCECPKCLVEGGHVRCRACGRTDTVVDWHSQTCEDRADCAAYVKARRAENPRMEMIEMAEKAGKEERAEKAAKKTPKNAPKPCRCECGEQTSGGLFLPGHDAKLKSREQSVMRDPAQRIEDREAARTRLRQERERSGKPGWLSAEDEARDFQAERKAFEAKQKEDAAKAKEEATAGAK